MLNSQKQAGTYADSYERFPASKHMGCPSATECDPSEDGLEVRVQDMNAAMNIRKERAEA